MAQLSRLVQITSVLQAKYDVVVTNPPYLNKMDKTLKSYVKKYYKDYSGDLFSVFIWLNSTMTVKDGYSAYMTPFVWMFIKTYEALRTKILDTVSISSLIQMEYSAFEEATVPIDTFVLKNSHDQIGSYVKLSAFKGGMEVQRQKVLEAINDPDCKYLYRANQANFGKIPGSPLAYWASEADIDAFVNNPSLGQLAPAQSGLKSGDNSKFIRAWWEPNFSAVGIGYTASEAKETQKKWFPHNKGGFFRKWFGNRELIVNYEQNGASIQKNGLLANKSFSFQGAEHYFHEGITWTAKTSSQNSFRYSPTGSIFDSNAGPMLFSTNKTKLLVLLGLLNSTVVRHFLKFINPTINLQNGDIDHIPVIHSLVNSTLVSEKVASSVDITKHDYDSSETSWDYQVGILLPGIAEHTLALLKKIGQIRPFAPNLCQIINHIKQRSVE